MAKFYFEVKSIYDKYFQDTPLIWEGHTDFKSLDQSNPDIAKLTAIEAAMESHGQSNPYMNTLYAHFKSLSEASDDVDSFDSGADADGSDPDDELGKNEETFATKYPTVDAKETLKKVYVQWLDAMSNKAFFKTIAAFYDMAKMNQLNFIDRAFLWKFLKAVSSCITHLLIEGEQREESVCLVDTYFDSLNECLLNTIHAKSKDDVIQSFLYMVSFLGLNRDIHSMGSESSSDAEMPQAKDSAPAGGDDSIGEF